MPLNPSFSKTSDSKVAFFYELAEDEDISKLNLEVCLYRHRRTSRSQNQSLTSFPPQSPAYSTLEVADS